jgi:hypothetical protein
MVFKRRDGRCRRDDIGLRACGIELLEDMHLDGCETVNPLEDVDVATVCPGFVHGKRRFAVGPFELEAAQGDIFIWRERK